METVMTTMSTRCVVRPAPDDALGNPASTARFLVIDRGTAQTMPLLAGRPLARSKRRPCGWPGKRTPDSDLQWGWRYVEPGSGLALLCIRPGRGPLEYDGRRLASRAPS